MRFLAFLSLFLMLQLLAFSQEGASIARKNFEAVFTDNAPSIDGIANEQVWNRAEIITDFVQSSPHPEVR